jgi:[ribosomal protein S18]-alanine N-acetyltransferase
MAERSVEFDAAIAIRAMREADLSAVLRVERAAYDYPWSERVFRDCLRVGYRCWLLAEADCIHGHLILSIAAGEAHVLNLCVEPVARGRGHARRLLTFGLQQSARAGADSVFLEVRPSNHVAIALYESIGFNEIGVRPNYYPAAHGRREAAMVMARPLEPIR